MTLCGGEEEGCPALAYGPSACVCRGRPLTQREYCWRCRRVTNHSGDYDETYGTVVRHCDPCREEAESD